MVLPTVSYRLDDLISAFDLPQPTLIKLDVDGPEAEVLAGADEALSNPALRGCLVELDIRHADVHGCRRSAHRKGFRIESSHSRGEGDPLQNVIFTRA